MNAPDKVLAAAVAHRTGSHKPTAHGEPAVAFTLDGQPALAKAGESIFDAAARQGVHIPHLCHQSGLRPDGNCRACVVEVAGERTLAASCCRPVTLDMVVHTRSERARKSQAMVLELLLADRPAQGHPRPGADPSLPFGELSQWANAQGVQVRPALAALRQTGPAPDLSHPAMAVNLDACIQCTRCVRACREEQVNDVIGMALRGADTHVAFDLADPMGASTCVACGECVQACPTGALSAKAVSTRVDREVDSVCPFCGVGCQLTYQVQVVDPVADPGAVAVSVTGSTGVSAGTGSDLVVSAAGRPRERIVAVQGRDGPANGGRLCVKGRFGFDYIHHPDRLTVPLVRKAGVAKDPALIQNPPAGPDGWREVFREATWDEALALAAGSLRRLRDAHGPGSLAGFGSAKGSNEEAYLFQKLVRTAFGTHNVDHCTRLCHASSVAALLEGVGSGAVSNPVADVELADFILVIGSNPTANHPVAATWMKNAAKRGARIVLADPRRTDIARHAWRTLNFKPDADVALVNALLHVVFEENLVNADFVASRVANADAVRAAVQAFSPEAMGPVCGIPADTLREVARAYATSTNAIILWGMGVSQHVHGTDNVRALIALATVTGQIGRPGTGLHPLRGQNNVQGASDAGLIPFMLPNYQPVSDPVVRGWFEQFWATPLSTTPGLTVVDILNSALLADDDPARIRGLYVMGENPAMSDPDLNHARHALASLDHLVVQDIFLTETAWLADVVLPASAWPEKWGTVSNTDRTVQLGRQAVQPPGDARADLWIIQQLGQRLGRADGVPLGWAYDEPANANANAAPPAGSVDTPAAFDATGVGANSPHYHGVARVYDEMRQAMHAVIGGITWDRLLRDGAVTYPCLTESDPGQHVVFTDRFPTADGRVRLQPTTLVPADERPDAEYPLVLITGRQLEHWHTGSMTRRAGVLDALEPGPTVSMHAADLAALGVQPGQRIRIESRRGSVELTARCDAGSQPGVVFIPFAYVEAAANLLTNAALDPFGKIPEFKYCAVRAQAVVEG